MPEFESRRAPLVRLLQNPVTVERGIGVVLWAGLFLVLLTKSPF